MLNWGVKHGVIGSNPLKAIKPLRHDCPRQRRPLSLAEVNRLLEASREPWKSVWYAFLTTGMRYAEVRELRFTDLDWTNREIIIRAGVAKNHRERRIPMDDRLYQILAERLAQRDQRQPGRGVTPKQDAQIKARFTKDHVFTGALCTPLSHAMLYRSFHLSCKRSGIEALTLDSQGREVEHLDLHSLRVTFATEQIENGSDPKTVQELLGHRTLDMTMRLYAKIRHQSKRQAIGRLRYGGGAQAPEHVVELPAKDGLTVQDGHKSVTTDQEHRKESA
jgi:integrase